MSYIEKRHYALGTWIESQYPFGLYRRARAMCSDGVVRNCKRVAATADTFFSVPASMTVAGRTVSGYITTETAQGYSTATDNDPTVVKFNAYSYGANGALLPTGLWKDTT